MTWEYGKMLYKKAGGEGLGGMQQQGAPSRDTAGVA